MEVKWTALRKTSKPSPAHTGSLCPLEKGDRTSYQHHQVFQDLGQPAVASFPFSLTRHHPSAWRCSLLKWRPTHSHWAQLTCPSWLSLNWKVQDRNLIIFWDPSRSSSSFHWRIWIPSLFIDAGAIWKTRHDALQCEGATLLMSATPMKNDNSYCA